MPGDDEREILLDYLRYYRLTIEMKCAGLDAAQLAQRSVAAFDDVAAGAGATPRRGRATHAAGQMAGEDAPRLYATDEDRDGDWNGAVADPAVVEEAMARWRTEMASPSASSPARRLARTPVRPRPRRGHLSLRDLLVAQIAEYARHCGHADLLRERIDGRVGQ